MFSYVYVCAHVSLSMPVCVLMCLHRYMHVCLSELRAFVCVFLSEHVHMERGYPLILLSLGTLGLPVLGVRRVELPPLSHTPLERRFLPDSSAKPPHCPLSLFPLHVREVGVGGHMGCLYQNTPPWALPISPQPFSLATGYAAPHQGPQGRRYRCKVPPSWWAVSRQQNLKDFQAQTKMGCGCGGPAGRDESCFVEAGGVQRGGITVVGDPSTPGHHVVCLLAFFSGMRVAGHGS